MGEAISVVIITKNEEALIGRCVDSVDGLADEVVVVDSESTDRTREIAAEHGARVIIKPFLGFVEQKRFACAQASCPWVLSLDADEALSNELRQALLQLKEAGFPWDGCEFNRRTFYLTDWFYQGGWYPDRKLRLFRRDMVLWMGENPHDYAGLPSTARVGLIAADILHLTYENLADHLRQINAFSGAAASAKASRGKFISPVGLLFHPLFKVFRTYFIDRAFLQGTRGIVFSVMAGISVFMKYAKLWELSVRREDSKDRRSP
ncbi:MAG: glycosyltransferase family 2 protein [Chitinispirillaceae bacterium]|nr:glycosyltransferase family 2 protein [Chitinispirillaceae bacterium]